MECQTVRESAKSIARSSPEIKGDNVDFECGAAQLEDLVVCWADGEHIIRFMELVPLTQYGLQASNTYAPMQSKHLSMHQQANASYETALPGSPGSSVPVAPRLGILRGYMPQPRRLHLPRGRFRIPRAGGSVML